MHTLTEKVTFCANIELKDRLGNMSKQRDGDSMLIADLQSQEADCRKQIIGSTRHCKQGHCRNYVRMQDLLLRFYVNK